MSTADQRARRTARALAAVERFGDQPTSAPVATTRRQRCPGSKLLLADTVASASDPFHHYAATCPTCARTFLLPQYSLPVHYVNVPGSVPVESTPDPELRGAALAQDFKRRRHDAATPADDQPATCADQPELSAGHIAIVNGYEYYAIGGHVYMAPMYAPICDVRNHTRIGRWESSLEHWTRYNTLQRLRDTYARLAAVPA